MKKILLILIVFSIFKNVFSQTNDNKDIIIFSKGTALLDLLHYKLDIFDRIEDIDTTKINGNTEIEFLKEIKQDILEESLKYFEEILEKYPKSKLKYRTMSNAAYIHNILNNKNKAINYYKMIIESKANDNEKGGSGSGIMANPFTLYKNSACKNLTEIYIEKKQYDVALKFLKLTKKYPFKHFCGNAYAADEIYIATLYTKIFKGKNKIKKAFKYSLPHVFYNGLGDNSEILNLAIGLINKIYTKEEIKNEIEKAAKSIKINNKGDATIKIFGKRINMGNTDILIWRLHLSGDDFLKMSDAEKGEKMFKSSNLYKKLTKKSP